MHKNGMKDEHLRCFWPFFATFVVRFHMVHRWAFASLSPYTHAPGLGCYCKHLYDRTRGGKRPGLDRPEKNMKERPPPRRLDQPGKRGLTRRAGTSWAEQAAGAPTPRTGPDAAQRTTTRRCNRHRAEDEAEGMQSSNEVAGPRGSRETNKRRGAPRDGEGQCAGCDRL